MTSLIPIYISEKVFTEDSRVQLAIDLHAIRSHLHKHLSTVATESGLSAEQIDDMEMGVFEYVDHQYNIRPLLALLDYYGEPIDLYLSNYH